MAELLVQIKRFEEHKTEAGITDYYGPGIEPDAMVKAMLVAIFSVRNYITKSQIKYTAVQPKNRLNYKPLNKIIWD